MLVMLRQATQGLGLGRDLLFNCELSVARLSQRRRHGGLHGLSTSSVAGHACPDGQALLYLGPADSMCMLKLALQ
jgi:hypothetical protein